MVPSYSGKWFVVPGVAVLGYLGGKAIEEASNIDVSCVFRNDGSSYETTLREVSRNSPMILVHRDKRTFLFRRDNLIECIDL